MWKKKADLKWIKPARLRYFSILFHARAISGRWLIMPIPIRESRVPLASILALARGLYPTPFPIYCMYVYICTRVCNLEKAPLVTNVRKCPETAGYFRIARDLYIHYIYCSILLYWCFRGWPRIYIRERCINSINLLVDVAATREGLLFRGLYMYIEGMRVTRGCGRS